MCTRNLRNLFAAAPNPARYIPSLPQPHLRRLQHSKHLLLRPAHIRVRRLARAAGQEGQAGEVVSVDLRREPVCMRPWVKVMRQGSAPFTTKTYSTPSVSQLHGPWRVRHVPSKAQLKARVPFYNPRLLPSLTCGRAISHQWPCPWASCDAASLPSGMATAVKMRAVWSSLTLATHPPSMPH